HHGNAAGNADKNQAHHVFGLVGQQPDGQEEHEQRAQNPVQKQREADDARVFEDRGQLLVLDL
nr:hypothetical protein [Tanacetum cinerariifolium]